MPKPGIPRVFVDANVLLAALAVSLSPARVVVSLACLKKQPFRLVLADYVRREIDQNLAQHPPELSLLFQQLLRLIRPLVVRLPTPEEVLAVRGVIRHLHDEPVWASALISPRPHVIVSDNKRDFNQRVAARIGIPIMTTHNFLDRLVSLPFGGFLP